MLAMALNLDPQQPQATTDLQTLAAAGFPGVEPNVHDPTLVPMALERCRACGLAPISLPTGRMACFAGEAVGGARATIQAAADAAAAGGVPLIVGLIRGRPAVDRAAAERFLASELPAALARLPGLRVLLEPIAATDCAWPNTLAEGVEALRLLGDHPRISLLADTVHLLRSGEVAEIPRLIGRIGLVQIEGPDRAVPTAADAGLIAAARAALAAGVPVSFEMPGNRVDHAAACMAWARALG